MASHGLECVPLVTSMDAQWDALVSQSPDGWLFGTALWQHLVSGVSEWGYADCSFAVFRDGRMLGVMPLQLSREHVLSSLAFGSGGPIVAASVTGGLRESVIRVMLTHMRKIAVEKGAVGLMVIISPLTENSLLNRTGVNPLICHGYRDTSEHALIADLTADESTLWGSLAYDARRSVKKAASGGYTVEQVSWELCLDDYYQIHRETYERTGAQPHPRAYFERIAMDLAPRKHAVLWGARDSKGEWVAFHNDARFGKACQYWTGCCKSEHLDTGVNYLLFWKAIAGARGDGCRWYELGEVYPGVCEGKLHGLTVFKSKFGGEIRRYFKGELPLIPPDRLAGACMVESPLRRWLRATRDLVRAVPGIRVRRGSSLACR